MRKTYKPTKSQGVLMQQVIGSLQEREIAVLKGREDGKTRMHYHVVNALAEYSSERIERHIFISSKQKQTDDVIILPNIRFDRTTKVTEAWLSRQIMQHCGHKSVKWLSGYELTEKFNEFLLELANKGVILAVAVDNAELLSERSFTVIKAMNELVIDKVEVGIAALLAGQVMKMNCTPGFMRHTREFQVGKIGTEEIRDMLATHFPNEAGNITTRVIERIGQEETMLEMVQYTRKLIEISRDNKIRHINEEVIQLAKAA